MATNHLKFEYNGHEVSPCSWIGLFKTDVSRPIVVTIWNAGKQVTKNPGKERGAVPRYHQDPVIPVTRPCSQHTKDWPAKEDLLCQEDSDSDDDESDSDSEESGETPLAGIVILSSFYLPFRRR